MHFYGDRNGLIKHGIQTACARFGGHGSGEYPYNNYDDVFGLQRSALGRRDRWLDLVCTAAAAARGDVRWRASSRQGGLRGLQILRGGGSSGCRVHTQVEGDDGKARREDGGASR